VAEQNKFRQAEKAVIFYKEEALAAKKQANLLKMELDKQMNAVQQKNREFEES